jgi:hypothetical protein
MNKRENRLNNKNIIIFKQKLKMNKNKLYYSIDY